jgi:hypothetical protein
VPEYGLAIFLDVLIEQETGSRVRHDFGQHRLADLKRVAAQVVAVHLDDVESVQEHAGVIPPIANAIKVSHPVVVTGDGLTIDDARSRAQPSHGFDNQRETVRQVISRPTIEADPLAVLTGDNPEAIVLDFVQPQRPGRRALSFCGEALGRIVPAGRAFYVAAKRFGI